MAAISNTNSTYNIKGIRESLGNIISNISPTETPVYSGSKKGSAKQTFNENLLDALAAADTSNAQLEGDDVTSFGATVQPTRVGNYTQISTKKMIASGTSEAVDIAGRASDTAYQMAKKGVELKRDMEAIILANQAANAGGVTTARTTAGLLAWIKTNVDVVTATNTPSYTSVPNATRTDGTARTFTETMLKNVIQLCYVSGGKPDTVLVSPKNKVVASGFSGVATKQANQKLTGQAVIIGAADVYVSDFGTFTIVPDLFQRDKDVFVLDFAYLGIDFLRKMFVKDLAETGDAKKKLMVVEWATLVKNEAALGLVADCGA